jgi:hypothetical protein
MRKEKSYFRIIINSLIFFIVIALPADVEKLVPKPNENTYPLSFFPQNYMSDSPIEPLELFYTESSPIQPKYIPLEDVTLLSPPSTLPISNPLPNHNVSPNLNLTNLTQLLNQIQSVDFTKIIQNLPPISMPLPLNLSSNIPPGPVSSHFDYSIPPSSTPFPSNNIPPATGQFMPLSSIVTTSSTTPSTASDTKVRPSSSSKTDAKKQYKSRKPPPKVPYLPCKHFMTTGKCPFGERCTFLHVNPPDR